ncbi:Presenilin [Dictyocaulus viviparus]|uniref:Presenilin n=1 Tax=Dictyocaulus viviparus TaxID=29172 RepID=A0A0D8XWV7_DICVI|nr:Presenilin [Dictyocaulus viviparus]
MIYTEPSDDAVTELLHAIINASTFLLLVVISTFLLLFLFYYKFYCLLHGFIMLSTFMLVTLFSFMQYQQILSDLNIPVSIVVMVFIHLNIAVVQLMSIFWIGPMKVQQGSLILISVTVTLTIMQILPKWTSWTLLVTLALWDLFAVLSPCGPLKLLVETAEKRGEDLMPAMIYTGIASFLQSTSSKSPTSAEVEGSSPIKDKIKTKSSGNTVESLRMPSLNSEAEERNIRLGLGDFIFYSLLVGSASVDGDWVTTLACFVSILTGLGFTLVLLVILQKALPALPISITFGVLAYFSSRYAVSKFVLELNRKLMFL